MAYNYLAYLRAAAGARCGWAAPRSRSLETTSLTCVPRPSSRLVIIIIIIIIYIYLIFIYLFWGLTSLTCVHRPSSRLVIIVIIIIYIYYLFILRTHVTRWLACLAQVHLWFPPPLFSLKICITEYSFLPPHNPPFFFLRTAQYLLTKKGRDGVMQIVVSWVRKFPIKSLHTKECRDSAEDVSGREARAKDFGVDLQIIFSYKM